MSSDTTAMRPETAAPYPGFRPFRADEEHLFFGREKQTDELLDRLSRQRFLAVLGVSGSGKSSLVRAGLLPTLQGGFLVAAGADWHTVTMRPGVDSLGALARALCGLDEEARDGGGELEEGELQARLTEVTLRSGGLGLIRAVRHLRLPAGTNLLLLVDQFEELFRYKQRADAAAAEDDAAAFVKLLLEATGQEELPLFVVLTMRSDFLGDCADFPGFAEAINRGQYLIPKMTRDEMRLAITGPARVAGAAVSERLVQTLLNAGGDHPAQLPILQHALMRTWEETRRGAGTDGGILLDLEVYRRIGGVDEAIALHAEEAFAELDEGLRGTCERLFRALTQRSRDPRGTRRPTPLGELAAITGDSTDELMRVIEVFHREGRWFLMPPPGVEIAPGTVIDISHESLMHEWHRLAAWIRDEAESVRVYLRLAEAARLNAEGKASLFRNPSLQVALDWRERERPSQAWGLRYDPGYSTAMDFLHRSALEQHRLEELARVTRQRDRRRILLTSIVTMASVALIIGGVSIWVLYRAAYADKADWLREMVNSEARLIEAMADFDQELVSADPEASTLAKIRNAHRLRGGFGDTGEFVLAKMQGNQILYLLEERFGEYGDTRTVPVDSELAQPMRHALSGEPGWLVGPDYRGRRVLAAHEPLRVYGWGIVAKIDVEEIRAPFVRAGWIAVGVALVVMLAGAYLTLKLSDPPLQRMVQLAGLQHAGIRFTSES